MPAPPLSAQTVAVIAAAIACSARFHFAATGWFGVVRTVMMVLGGLVVVALVLIVLVAIVSGVLGMIGRLRRR